MQAYGHHSLRRSAQVKPVVKQKRHLLVTDGYQKGPATYPTAHIPQLAEVIFIEWLIAWLARGGLCLFLRAE